jgi:hypothetical protein
MYTYLNVSNYQDESDHFLKSFIEKKSDEALTEESSFLETEKKNTWSIWKLEKI